MGLFPHIFPPSTQNVIIHCLVFTAHHSQDSIPLCVHNNDACVWMRIATLEGGGQAGARLDTSVGPWLFKPPMHIYFA